MKQLTFITIFFLFLSSKIFSQEIIDETTIICQYEYSYVNDTLHNTLRNDLFILQIGEKHSKFYSYYTSQYDSLMATPDGDIKKKESLKNAVADFRNHKDRSKFLDSFVRPRSRTSIYKNFPQGQMTVTDFLGGDYVTYKDSLDKLDWKIVDSTTTILEFNCQQATCNFRGRQWVVWFTPEIPISNGPWKLGGLPGLIIKAYDKYSHHIFNLVGIEKNNNIPLIWDDKPYHKVNRKVFLKATKHAADNASTILGAESNININSKANKPIAHDLLERDYKY